MTAAAPLTTGAIGADCLPAVEAISKRAFDPRYGEAWTSAQCLAALALPGYRLRGCWRGDDAKTGLVGFAIDRTVVDESELLLLATDPAARRTGVARALLDDWLAMARERHVTRLFLEMRQDNDARALYELFGFREIARRIAYYRGGDGLLRDAVTMDRTIG
jgi:[ribosomal protein S18]-alanine N-acetyltransferase